MAMLPWISTSGLVIITCIESLMLSDLAVSDG